MIRILLTIFIGIYLLISFLSWDILWVSNKYNIFYRFVYLCLSIFFIYLNWDHLETKRPSILETKKIIEPEETKNEYWC